MSDQQRPPAKFGSTVAVNKTEPPPSRRNTMSMGSVREDKPSLAVRDERLAPPPLPVISPVEERTRVMRGRPVTIADSVAPPTIATPPLEDLESAQAVPAGIEMVIIEEQQLPGGERKPWRAAEVWTKRRVYALDSTYKCLEVLDRETGRAEVAHEMVGARLGGGRLREGDKVRFTYPLPIPGAEAMFMKAKKHGYTSPVERMVVRVRVLVTSADEVAPSWDEIGSRWSDPPPRSR